MATEIRIYVDGWPYLINFTGTIDIERYWESSTCVLRVASDDSKFTLKLDEEQIQKEKEFIMSLHKKSLL